MLSKVIALHVQHMSDDYLNVEKSTEPGTSQYEGIGQTLRNQRRHRTTILVATLVVIMIVALLSHQHILSTINNYLSFVIQQQQYDHQLKQFFITTAQEKNHNIYHQPATLENLANEFIPKKSQLPIARFTSEQHRLRVLESLQSQLRGIEVQRLLEATPANPTVTYQWPVLGTSVKSSQIDYLENFPGIHITAGEGTAVLAIESGQVIHVEETKNGYGTLIIVQHSDEMLAVYAKNRQSAVKKGEHVKRGQKLGETGLTHLYQKPGLYFEIRHNGAAENPFLYLASS